MMSNPTVERLSDAAEVSQSARMMVESEPWITLGLTLDVAQKVLTDPAREHYAIRDAAGVAAFTVLDMRGLLAGYIQVLCVRRDIRGSGLGSALLGWAEARIFRDSPNAFICVSSFNAGARRLYERLGFEPIGVLRELIVPGHDELLLRKTRGPWSEFRQTR
jgi:[ribosomal protein S18]-alanine N-acetyltransferase